MIEIVSSPLSVTVLYSCPYYNVSYQECMGLLSVGSQSCYVLKSCMRYYKVIFDQPIEGLMAVNESIDFKMELLQ